MLNSMNQVATFAKCRRLLRSVQRLSNDLATKQALHEAELRLEQLDLLLVEFSDGTPVGVGQVRVNFEAALRKKTFAEAIYYFAHRAVNLLETVYGRRTLNRKGHVLGVTIVRNHLIEHADSDSAGLMSQNWILDIPEGIVLKPFGGIPQAHVDRGLHPNIDELRIAVEALLMANGASES